MKKVLSLTLASLMVFGAATVSFATANTSGGKIDGMCKSLSVGYSGDSDLGEIAPQDKLVEYIDLTEDMFSWDDGYIPAATPGSLSPSQIRKAKLTVRASNSKVLDSVTLNAGKSRIEVKFIDELVSVKEQDFDFDVILSIDGRRQSDYAMNFTGTMANPITEVYAGTEYADISSGEVAEAMEYIKNINLDLGEGVTVSTSLSKGKLCYGTAHHIPSDDKDDLMSEHTSIEECIALKTVGLSRAASTVTLGDAFSGYYVYDKDGKYLGLGRDKLEFSEKYYLSKEKLEEIPEDEAGDIEPESIPEPEAIETGSGDDESYPYNVNDNPYTGR